MYLLLHLTFLFLEYSQQFGHLEELWDHLNMANVGQFLANNDGDNIFKEVLKY